MWKSAQQWNEKLKAEASFYRNYFIWKSTSPPPAWPPSSIQFRGVIILTSFSLSAVWSPRNLLPLQSSLPTVLSWEKWAACNCWSSVSWRLFSTPLTSWSLLSSWSILTLVAPLSSTLLARTLVWLCPGFCIQSTLLIALRRNLTTTRISLPWLVS